MQCCGREVVKNDQTFFFLLSYRYYKKSLNYLCLANNRCILRKAKVSKFVKHFQVGEIPFESIRKIVNTLLQHADYELDNVPEYTSFYNMNS